MKKLLLLLLLIVKFQIPTEFTSFDLNRHTSALFLGHMDHCILGQLFLLKKILYPIQQYLNPKKQHQKIIINSIPHPKMID
jgi:hypothetical protein